MARKDPSRQSQFLGRASDQWIIDLHCEEVEKRRKAAEVLGWIGKEAVSPLLEALHDKDPQVRDFATNSLAELGKDALPTLLNKLQSSDKDDREVAALPLRKMGVEAAPDLFKLLKKSNVSDKTRKLVINILQSFGSHALPLLLHAINEPKTRFESLTVIVKLGTESVPAILEYFSNSKLSEAALLALEKIGPAAAPRLVQALSHDELVTRKAAALALYNLDDDAAPAVNDLRRAYRDRDPGLRALILLTFKSVGNKAQGALPEITKGLKDRDELNRFCAALAAIRVKGNNTELQDELKKAVNAPSTAIRHAATLALLKRRPDLQEKLLPNLSEALVPPQKDEKNWASKLLREWTLQSSLNIPAVTELFENEILSISKDASALFSKLNSQSLPKVLETYKSSSKSSRLALKSSFEKFGPEAIAPLIDAFAESGPLAELCASIFKKLGAEALPPLQNLYLQASRANDEDCLVRIIRAYAEVGSPALEALLNALVDKNEQVRRAAALALGRFDGDAAHALPTLIRAMRDKVAAVRRAAAKTLGNMGDRALPALKQALVHRDRRMRQGAIYALKKYDASGQVVLDALEDTLSDTRWYIRRSSLSALGRLKQKALSSSPKIVPFLDDRDARIRFAAADALSFIEPAQAKPALPLFMEALGNAAIRQTAAEALERMGLHAVLPLIQHSQTDPKHNAAQNILWRISARNIPGLAKDLPLEQLPQSPKLNASTLVNLIKHLQSKDPTQRALAAWALGTQGADAHAAIPKLILTLSDPHEETAKASSLALGQIGIPAIPALIQFLQEGSEELRPITVETLGRIESGDLAVANCLLGRLQDPLIDPDEAHEISLVLSQMTSRSQGSKAIPEAIKILEIGNPHARKSIISALANAGPKAIPELLLAANHPHIRVRQGSINALRQIDEQCIAALIRCLSSQKHRHAAALAIGLKSEDWIVRQRPKRLTKLLDLESKLLVETLIKSLKDPDDRPWIADALGKIGAPAIPYLVRALRTEKGEARHAVAIALASASPFLSDAVIPFLASTIRGDNPELRRAAAITLGSLPHSESLIETLEELAEDSQVPVRQWTMVALGQLEGSDITLLLNGLRDQAPKVRQSAAFSLRALGARAREAYDLLLQHLEDVDEHVRWRAVGALGRIFEESKDLALESERTIATIIGKLLDTSAKVVQGSALALVRIGPKAIAQLSQALSSEHESARRWATWALGKIGENAYSPEIRNAVPALCNILNDSDPSIAQSAAWALGKIGPDAREAVPALRQSLIDGHTGLRWFATFALGAIGREARDALPELEVALADDDEDVRREAAFALAQISSASDEKILPVLISILEARVALRDTSFRRRALESLEALGSKTAPYLFETLKRTNPSARYGAAIVLAKVSPLAVHAVLPILIDALRSQEADMQPSAVEALGLLGLEAQSAIPFLLDCLESEFDAVRAASIKALALVTPKPQLILQNLADALEDRSPELRTLAAKTIQELAKRARPEHLEPIIPKLITQLADPDPTVSKEIGQTLGQLGAVAVAPLIAILPHKNHLVAHSAVRSLIQIGLDAIPQLLRSMASPQVWTRLRAAEAMTAIWPVASLAIPDLLESLQSNDIWVRQNALRLLEATSSQLQRRQAKFTEQRPMQLLESNRQNNKKKSRRRETFVFEDNSDEDGLAYE
ncbi:MAG: HEAT repeat domain-containing protein [Planctomycetota bacterium]|nr:HEAT repeat domain-containing protein [Planctomycetota bacterium]